MKKNHLPILGVGPMYVIIIVGMTIISIILSATNIIPIITIKNLRWILILLGVLCVFDRLDAHIIKNELVTTGAYAYVRNPVYSAFMLVCTGILFGYGNIVLLILPFFYWAFMTVFMKLTEEKWLEDLYGQEYISYCKSVNRCIPWKGKKL